MATRPLPSAQFVTFIACVCLATMPAASRVGVVVPACAAGAVSWQVGEGLQRRLGMPVGVTWSEVPLRDALDNLARAQQTAIFLDRRVDPDQRIGFTASNVSLGQALEQLASQLGLAVSVWDSLVFLGPAEDTKKLATLVEIKNDEIARLPGNVRGRLERRTACNWPALAQPRGLLDELSQEMAWEIRGLQRIPYDLWPAYDLPPLTMAERLTLITAGFGLHFTMHADGQYVELIKMPETVALRRAYRAPRQTSRFAAKLTEAFPHITVETDGTQIIVEGLAEDHRMIEDLLSGKTGTTAAAVRGTETRYTLNVENKPAGSVLRALATKLSLVTDVDPSASQHFDRLISFRVQDATREELLDSALKPLGLSYRLSGNVLEIFPTDM